MKMKLLRTAPKFLACCACPTLILAGCSGASGDGALYSPLPRVAAAAGGWLAGSQVEGRNKEAAAAAAAAAYQAAEAAQKKGIEAKQRNEMKREEELKKEAGLH